MDGRRQQVETSEKEGSSEKEGEMCYCEAHRMNYYCSDGCPLCKKESKTWKEALLLSSMEKARRVPSRRP